MDPLAKLFGSPALVKIMRLFLFNEEEAFTTDDVSFRTKTSKDTARKELKHLVNAGVLKKRSTKSPISYMASPRFAHYEALKTFLRSATGITDARIASSLKKTGSLRLVALSGLFTGVMESKVDLLIVGARIDEKAIAAAVRTLEADLGRELRYAAFATLDFRYRLGVYDRLLRDVFDYPHRLVLDKIGM